MAFWYLGAALLLNPNNPKSPSSLFRSKITLNQIEFREVAKFKITFFFVRNPDLMGNCRLPLVVQDFKYMERSL